MCVCWEVNCLDQDDDTVPYDLVWRQFRNRCKAVTPQGFHSNYQSSKKSSTVSAMYILYSMHASVIFQGKIRGPAGELCKTEHHNVALIHELLPAVTFPLIHSIHSTASSSSSHQIVLWQIHLVDTHYSAANPTAKDEDDPKSEHVYVLSVSH